MIGSLLKNFILIFLCLFSEYVISQSAKDWCSVYFSRLKKSSESKFHNQEIPGEEVMSAFRNGHRGSQNFSHTLLRAENLLHYKFLEAIGMNWEDPQHSKVSRKSILSAIQARVNDAIKSGKLNRDEVILPGSIQTIESKGTGSKTKYRHKLIPYGHDASPPNSNTDSKFHNLTLLDQIKGSTEGLFELTEGTFFEHDLGHLSGLLKDFRFMAAFRNKARDFLRSSFGALFIKSYEEGAQVRFFGGIPLSVEELIRVNRFKSRYIYVSESLVVFPKKSRVEMTSFLLNKQSGWTPDSSQLPSVYDVKRSARALLLKDPALFERKFDQLQDFILKNGVFLGGAANDLYNPQRAGEELASAGYGENPAIMLSPAFLGNALKRANRAAIRRAPNGFFKVEDSEIPFMTEVNIELFARAYTLTLAGIKYPKAEDWVEWAYSDGSTDKIQDFDQDEMLAEISFE